MINSKIDYISHYKKLSINEIDKIIEEKGLVLEDVYKFCELQDYQIDRAIELGKALYYLYTYQKLNKNQIDKAIDKGNGLEYLIK